MIRPTEGIRNHPASKKEETFNFHLYLPPSSSQLCIPIHRFRLGVLREDWTPEELQHLQSCEKCRKLERLSQNHAWHPSNEALWRYLCKRLREKDAEEVEYHLEIDRCRRCRQCIGLMP